MSSSILPEFESRHPYPFGVLPDRVFPMDEEAFRQCFVARFPDSQTRAAICDGLFELRRTVLAHGLSATQWLNGSFVEGKRDPEDVDLVTFIDYDFMLTCDEDVQHFILSCLGGDATTRENFSCHSFLAASCPPGHPFFAEFDKVRVYWRKWFGQTREEPIRPGPFYPSIAKGFVEMTIGDPQRAPKINRERTAS